MSKPKQKRIKVGSVSLWLLLLLSERPMYGYEIIRELEKKFSGYWKPQTGTIYPVLDKLEKSNLVTSQIEFRESGPDRKHYALTEKGQQELNTSMLSWTKMTELLENYREVHQSIIRYKEIISLNDLAKAFINLGESLKLGTIDLTKIMSINSDITVQPTEPVNFKFLYAKEEEKMELHIEIEWTPQ